jgi:phosphonate degradation associated HDIG domain protein
MSELIVEELQAIYLSKGALRYEIGGASGVTQLEHALQTAALAERSGAHDELIVAALLHDLGHLIQSEHMVTASGELDSAHDDVHQYIALPFLRRWFGVGVLDPIKLHVDAKRYLCAVEPGYREQLSVGSQRSLQLQGGALTPAQASEFMQRPHAMDAVSLRRWDDRAKDANASVPPFDYWLPLLREVSCADAVSFSR